MKRVRWKLTLAYDGRSFFGWQRQPDQRTVQGELEKALSRFSNESIEVSGQGRTDRGVHALGQTAHADLPTRVTEDRLFGAMRSLLPEDLRLVAAEPVPDSFHARFDATSRRYEYQVATGPDLLNRHQRWEIGREPDLDLLNHYASLLNGSHDFSKLARMDPGEKRSTRCTLFTSVWNREPFGLVYTVEGDRFLRHMVRRLVGTMLRLEEGQRPTEAFQSLLIQRAEDAQIYTAPAHGLRLVRVSYP